MKSLIIANLKMNFTQEETKEYLSSLLSNIDFSNKNKLVICFPYTNLPLANQMLFGKKIIIGAQNVNQEEEGAFTGEISAKMLKELVCEYVLVGHSERRQYFMEKNKAINAKIKTLLKYGIKPVLCIGESGREREQGKTNQVLESQLEQALYGLYENELKSIIIAYEPIWAIGTGKTVTTKDINQAVVFIRETIEEHYSTAIASKIQVLYGGSVKVDNAKHYLQNNNINGVLIGGTSLSALRLAKIFNEN